MRIEDREAEVVVFRFARTVVEVSGEKDLESLRHGLISVRRHGRFTHATWTPIVMLRYAEASGLARAHGQILRGVPLRMTCHNFYHQVRQGLPSTVALRSLTTRRSGLGPA